MKHGETQIIRENLRRELIHAQSIGEDEYCDDLGFIIDFIDGKLKRSFVDDAAITSIEDAANYVGINLKPFEGA